MALAGLLASTVLRGFHPVIAGVRFGPYDTVFAVAGLLFLIAGIATLRPMRQDAKSPPASQDDLPVLSAP